MQRDEIQIINPGFHNHETQNPRARLAHELSWSCVNVPFREANTPVFRPHSHEGVGPLWTRASQGITALHKTRTIRNGKTKCDCDLGPKNLPAKESLPTGHGCRERSCTIASRHLDCRNASECSTSTCQTAPSFGRIVVKSE